MKKTRAMLKSEMTAYLEQSEIRKMTEKLAVEVERDLRGQEVLLVCPLKGSSLFVADFSRALKLQQTIEFVVVRAPASGGNISISRDINVPIKGRHVLVCEEIIDTGRTLNFLKNRILLGEPASVRILTLLDKPARRELSINPDYVGMTVDDRYLVGYGMDADELGRNYSQIYSFKQ